MLSFVIGLAALALGIWGMSATWMISLEMLKMLLFLGLVCFGVVAILGGVRQLKTSE